MADDYSDLSKFVPARDSYELPGGTFVPDKPKSLMQRANDVITRIGGQNKPDEADVDAEGVAKAKADEQAKQDRIAAYQKENPIGGTVDRYAKSTAAGFISALGQPVQYVGRKLGIKPLEDAGSAASDYAENITPPDQSFGEQLAGGLGSTASFFIPGTGVAKGVGLAARALGGGAIAAGRAAGATAAEIAAAGKAISRANTAAEYAGAGTASGAETLGNMEQTYEDALKNTGNEAHAEGQAIKDGILNLPVNFIADKLGIFGAVRQRAADGAFKAAISAGAPIPAAEQAARTAASSVKTPLAKDIAAASAAEGFQEGSQQVLQNVFGHNPTGEGVTESAVIGGLIGGGFGGVHSGLAARAMNEQLSTPEAAPGADMATETGNVAGSQPAPESDVQRDPETAVSTHPDDQTAVVNAQQHAVWTDTSTGEARPVKVMGPMGDVQGRPYSSVINPDGTQQVAPTDELKFDQPPGVLTRAAAIAATPVSQDAPSASEVARLNASLAQGQQDGADDKQLSEMEMQDQQQKRELDQAKTDMAFAKVAEFHRKNDEVAAQRQQSGIEEADARVEAARLKESEAQRRTILNGVLDTPDVSNVHGAFAAALDRAGYKGEYALPTKDEDALIKRHAATRAAIDEAQLRDATPAGTPNEMDVAALVPERKSSAPASGSSGEQSTAARPAPPSTILPDELLPAARAAKALKKKDQAIAAWFGAIKIYTRDNLGLSGHALDQKRSELMSAWKGWNPAQTASSPSTDQSSQGRSPSVESADRSRSSPSDQSRAEGSATPGGSSQSSDSGRPDRPASQGTPSAAVSTAAPAQSRPLASRAQPDVSASSPEALPPPLPDRAASATPAASAAPASQTTPAAASRQPQSSGTVMPSVGGAGPIAGRSSTAPAPAQPATPPSTSAGGEGTRTHGQSGASIGPQTTEGESKGPAGTASSSPSITGGESISPKGQSHVGAARLIVDSAKNGTPAFVSKSMHSAMAGFGLEVGKNDTPNTVIDRLRDALARHDKGGSNVPTETKGVSGAGSKSERGAETGSQPAGVDTNGDRSGAGERGDIRGVSNESAEGGARPPVETLELPDPVRKKAVPWASIHVSTVGDRFGVSTDFNTSRRGRGGPPSTTGDHATRAEAIAAGVADLRKSTKYAPDNYAEGKQLEHINKWLDGIEKNNGGPSGETPAPKTGAAPAGDKARIIPTRSGIKVQPLDANGNPTEEPRAPKPATLPVSDYGKKNTVFTADAAAAARERLRKKLGGNTLTAGIDPEVIQDGITLAGYHIEAGARSFVDFTRAMIGDLGDSVRPYLKSWYNAVRDYPGFDSQGMTEHAKMAKSPSMAIAESVQRELSEGRPITWRQLFGWADQAYSGTQAEGKYTSKDAYDAMEAGVNNWLMGRGFNPAVDATKARATIAELERYTALLPTQTKRTAEQDQFQQFSTVPAFAYAANWAAGIRKGDVYLEPSAGIGGLAAFGENAGAKLVLNELSARRAAVLSELFPEAKVTQENAEQLNNILPKDVQPDVVVMNPPFSSTAGRTATNNNMVGARHIEQALARLKPGGRLVAISGRGMAFSTPSFATWWRKIGAKYDIRAVIPVDGTGYAKYGTTFDNILIVIDKVPPSGRPVVTTEAKAYSDLVDLLSGIANDRPATNDQQSEQQPSQPQGEGSVPAGERQPGTGAGTGQPGAVRPAATGNRPDVDGSGRGNGQRGRGERPAGGVQHAGNDVGAVGSDQPAASDHADPASTGGSDSAGHRTGVTVESGMAERAAGELTDSVFEQYHPQRLSIPGAQPHPGPLEESAAMASVMPPAPTYTPNLPKETITNGDLSLAQLESVVYAGQAHEQMLPDGTRRGYFIGDGTGVGKGREIGGILLDNWRQGRQKGVWFSEKQGLMKDAKRDFGGVGGDASQIFNQNKTATESPIEMKQGILFSTYSTLRSEAQVSKEDKLKGVRSTDTRLKQIVDWFGKDYDGVIVFDEAHNAGNAIAIKGERGMSVPSEQALAMIDLQKQLPNARVVYVSATGATEVSNLAYATRLGLWGDGTAFDSVHQFINQMASGGLATMELVARDLKQLGAYISRSLSFRDVTYGRVEHQLTDLQRDIYDRLSEAWQVTLRNMEQALEMTGVTQNGVTRNGTRLRGMKSAYWNGQQRFFNQVITSMQMPSAIMQMEKDLADGKAVVLQLVSTNEAQQTRSLAKLNEGGGELEDLDLTPRDQLLEMVKRSFPVQEFESYTDEKGNKRSRPVSDSAGNPVENAEAVAMRDALVRDLEQIRVPDGPLEIVMNHFGADKVAEVTGRTQRVVRKPDEHGEVRAQLEPRNDRLAAADAESFIDDKKQILVFSDKGGTGFSYHADLTKKNQRPRSHFLIQPGWRADKAVQGFGRTHRSNEASAPHYWLVTTDVPAQKRFISSIARRLDQLGALTKGQRDASGQSMFSEKDNLESRYAANAVRTFLQSVQHGQIEGLDFRPMMVELGLEDRIDDHSGAIKDSGYPPTRQFLNRMLSLKMDMQNKVFDAFIAAMEAEIDVATEHGTLDTGMQTIRAMATRVVSDQVANVDKRTGAETRLVQLELTMPNTIHDFPTEKKAGGKIEWFVQNRSGRVWGRIKSGTRTTSYGAIMDRYRMLSTGGTQMMDADDFKEGAYKEISEAQASDLWKQENAKRPATYTKDAHMVVGAILPIWDRLKTDSAIQVARTNTSDGQRLLGRLILPADVDSVRERLSLSAPESKLSGAAVMRRVLGGETATLVNGWKLQRANVSGDDRVEVITTGGQPPWSHSNTAPGMFHERIGWKDRYFIETGAKGSAALERLLESKPVQKLAKPASLASVARTGQTTALNADLETRIRAGASAKSLLESIVLKSDDALNRVIARALIRVGVKPSVTLQSVDSVDPAKLPPAPKGVDPRTWKNSLSAMYDPNTNEIILFKTDATEHDVLHEVTHSATFNAITQNGMAARRMQALYDHVLKFGTFDRGAYGLESLDEFVSEAFSNRAFRDELRAIPAMRGSGFATAWDWFSGVVRSILGLQADSSNALAQVLEAGHALIQEGAETEQTGNVAGSETLAESSAPSSARTVGAASLANVRPTLGINTLRTSEGLFTTIKDAAINAASDVFTNHSTFTTAKLGMLPGLATMRQRSWVDPEHFGVVHRLAQTFLNTVSNFALRAANLAPDVLPQINSVHDVFRGLFDKSKRVSNEDLAKVTDTLYAGRENRKVYTDAELQARGLTDKQRELYAQSRDLLTRSLTDTHIAMLARVSQGKFAAAVKEAIEHGDTAPIIEAMKLALEAGETNVQRTQLQSTLAEAKEALAAATNGRDRMAQRRAIKDVQGQIDQLNAHGGELDLRDLIKSSEELQAKLQDLLDHGYIPHSRFGSWAVDVIYPNTQRARFSMFESQRQANAAVREFQERYPTAEIKVSAVSKEAHKIFQQLNPDVIELFGDVLARRGVLDPKESAVFQEYLRQAVNNRSAMKRFMHDKDVPGYDRDLRRVLASFSTSNARFAATLVHGRELTRAVEAIDKTTYGESRDAAQKLVDYIMDPQEEFTRFRAYLFMNYLGGSVASALSNMTQVPLAAFPRLHQYGGVEAVKQLAAASKIAGRRVFGAADLPADIKADVLRAERDGTLQPQEMHQMYAESIRGFGSSLTTRKFMQVMGSFFAVSEQWNRETTFIAALRMARSFDAAKFNAISLEAKQSITSPYDFAKLIVEDTQFVYSKANRPEWARGAFAPIFTFKMFSIQVLELYKRLPPTQRTIALGMLILMAGMNGLPFADDLDDLIDTIGQTLGYDTNAKQFKRAALTKAFGKPFSDLLLNGISSGLPLDVSARLGLANLIPGTGLLKKSNTDSGRTDDILEWLGVAGSLGKSAIQGAQAVQDGEWTKAALAVAPTAFQNAAKAVDMATTGEYRDQGGKKVTNVGPLDVAVKAIGFQPAKVAEESRLNREVNQNISLVKNVQSEITAKMVRAIVEGKPELRAEAIQELMDWNRKNPDSIIVIRPQSVATAVRNAQTERLQRDIRKSSPSIRGGIASEIRQ